MSKPTYLLGIDISTTGAKALLVDEQGQVRTSATTALSLSTPKPLWSEQDPGEWWSGAVRSIRQVLGEIGATGEQVRAIGLTGLMHGLVLLDAQNRVPGLKTRPAVAAALSAGVTALLAYSLPYRLGLILAALLGIVVGMVLEMQSNPGKSL